ncbi:MAG: group 1 truncated hemoglobin [Planctomycetota bacterium]|nr:MAG: group 1 truncated hemoglobin [Planctomycetota bacterium]
MEICSSRICSGSPGGNGNSCSNTASRPRRRGILATLRRWIAMTEDENGDTLFNLLGGKEKLEAIVHDAYRRILADPELAPFFERVDMNRLRRMQYEFLAAAFDGPVRYTGSDIRAIHAGRGIESKHFRKFVNHFAEAMRSHGVSEHLVDQMLGRIAVYHDLVVGGSAEDG